VGREAEAARRRCEAHAAIGEGNPLRDQAQERDWHETRPDGSWTERDVERLREPEGVAQPGEANLV
jgi:hypothetical protein